MLRKNVVDKFTCTKIAPWGLKMLLHSYPSVVLNSDVDLNTGLGFKTGLKFIFFEVLVLAKVVLILILALDGLEVLKNLQS